MPIINRRLKSNCFMSKMGLLFALSAFSSLSIASNSRVIKLGSCVARETLFVEIDPQSSVPRVGNSLRGNLKLIQDSADSKHGAFNRLIFEAPGTIFNLLRSSSSIHNETISSNVTRSENKLRIVSNKLIANAINKAKHMKAQYEFQFDNSNNSGMWKEFRFDNLGQKRKESSRLFILCPHALDLELIKKSFE